MPAISAHGPMLGKVLIDVSTLTADYEPGDFFTITAQAAGDIKYNDALGNEYTETFTAGQVVVAGAPGSGMTVPMKCSKVFMSGSVADFYAGFGP